MKKLFCLTVLTFLMCTWSYAQETLVKRTEEYCELSTSTPLLSRKLVARVDFGNGDEVLTDGQGKKLDFRSSVGALNYMNSLGWELINVHVRVSEGEGHTYYVMKRKLQ